MNYSIDSAPSSTQNVLITRPAAQNERLLQVLADRGESAAAIPFMALVPIEPDRKSLCILRDLAQSPAADRSGANGSLLTRPDVYDNILFVSANAVHYTAEALQSMQSIGAANALQTALQTALQRIPCIGMGSATASAIERQGWLLDQHTMRALPKAFTSEILLASKWAEQVQGKRILISRGVGGRESLSKALARKDAAVDHLETYERVCPQHDLGLLNALLQWCGQASEFGESPTNPKLRIVVLGSAETGINFLSQMLVAHQQSSQHHSGQQIGQERRGLAQVLSDCHLVVPSARVAKEVEDYLSAEAVDSGEAVQTLKLSIAENASDEAIADVVLEISSQYS